MNLGILGTGKIVKDLMAARDRLPAERIFILGTKRSREKTETLAAQYSLERCFFDYDEMLACSDIDTVYVALPNHLHFAFAKKALLAGKDCIVEKPVTSNYAQFCELRTLAGERGLILSEAMNIHELPAYRALKESLPALGNLKIVCLNYSQYSSRYDTFRQGTVLPAFDPHCSGGALMDLNVYNLHAVVGLFGAPKGVRYLANVERGIDTSGVLTLDYGSFKAVCIGAKDCRAPILSTFQGDAGCIQVHLPVNQMRGFTFTDNRGRETVKCFDDGTHRMVYEFEEFADVIRKRDFVRADRLLNISGTVSRIMQEARRQAGIVFDSDPLPQSPA